MKQYFISTKDNKFDPQTQFKDWLEFDIAQGHYSLNRLGRETNVNENMTSVEENEEISRAIDKIIEFDLEKKFIKITKDV